MNTENLADIIADPDALAKLQQCTSVNELVSRLNAAGAECSREEGLRFLRAWESIAAEDEELDLDEMDQVAGGSAGVASSGGFLGFIRSFFGLDAARGPKPAPEPKAMPLTIEKILSHMNQ